jgi:chromosome partitioning protein
VIPRNVRLAEAPSYGVPAVKFDVSCKGSQAYVELANEILGRTDPRGAPAIIGEEGA